MTDTEDKWAKLKAGIDCYACTPRPANNEYVLEIAPLSVSTLYLYRDQRYRGYCLLIFDPYHATELEGLSANDYQSYMNDLRLSAQAIRQTMQPDHLNFECLGNASPHLHWHIVPRYKTDPRWGGPIWESDSPKEIVMLTESEYNDLIVSIRLHLAT